MTEPCRCLVPFCPHWTRRFAVTVEWICAPHWKLVPKWLKARRSRAKRLAGKLDARFLARYTAQGQTYTEGQHRQVVAAWDLEDRLWGRCKIMAIERAAGITA